VLREDVLVIGDDLVKPSRGTITRAGFENNIEVCARYLAAWLDGSGCVPINWLMEDAATAEIARAQLWQWLHHCDGDNAREPLHLDDDTAIDLVLFEAALLNVASRLCDPALPGAARMREALELLEALTRRDTLEDFLTVPAYERL
jgi:malate synthase